MNLDLPGTLLIGLLMPLVLLVALVLGATAQWALRGRAKLAASSLIAGDATKSWLPWGTGSPRYAAWACCSSELLGRLSPLWSW